MAMQRTDHRGTIPSDLILSVSMVLLVAGCSSSEVVEPAPGAASRLYPEVFLSFPAGTPSFGELVRARVSIANATVDPIVIRGLDLPGQLPNDVPWLAARAGRTRYERGRRRVGWRPWMNDETEPVFALGYLLPGETLEVERLVRVRNPLQDVILTYQKADLGVYLPDASGPKRSQGSRREVFFHESSISRESTYRRARPGTEERLVLFVAAEESVLTRRQLTVQIAWAEESMPAAVTSELGVSGELSAFDVVAAWLLRRPETGEILLFAEATSEATGEASPAGESFPGVDFEVFDLADYSASAGADVLVDIHPEEDLERVAPADFLEFLRGAREQGRRVSVVALPLGGSRFQQVLRLR